VGGASRPEPAPVLARARVKVSGRVQGVFFRASAATEAATRGLSGWVRNEPDGSVAAVFQGPRDMVDELIEWCRIGPPAARVRDVQVAWEAPVSGETAFQAR
jgi:acylphosphatase